jgi:lysozyme family protein
MSFASVMVLVLKMEGTYSKVPGDSGGETVFGITRVYDPDWAGWRRVQRLTG